MSSYSRDKFSPAGRQLLRTLRQWDSRMSFTLPDTQKLRDMLVSVSVEERVRILKIRGGFYSPLHFAARCGEVGIITALLTSLPDQTQRMEVLTRTKAGCSPLHSAAVWGQLESVKVCCWWIVHESIH